MITTWKCLISRFMEDVNKRRQIFLSLSKLECGPQEINSKEIRLHWRFQGIAHLHDDVTRALHAGICNQEKNKMAACSGGGFTCCVPGCFTNSKRDTQRKRIWGVAGCTHYWGKISSRPLDTEYISKEEKKPTWTMFLLFFLWQNLITGGHPNQGEKWLLTNLRHPTKRHSLHLVYQFRPLQQRPMSPSVMVKRLDDWEKNWETFYV